MAYFKHLNQLIQEHSESEEDQQWIQSMIEDYIAGHKRKQDLPGKVQHILERFKQETGHGIV
jgi:hypothetical protein